MPTPTVRIQKAAAEAMRGVRIVLLDSVRLGSVSPEAGRAHDALAHDTIDFIASEDTRHHEPVDNMPTACWRCGTQDTVVYAISYGGWPEGSFCADCLGHEGVITAVRLP